MGTILQLGAIIVLTGLIMATIFTPQTAIKASATITPQAGIGATYLQLYNAATYIAQRYVPQVGLVSESEDRGSTVPDGTPAYRTFWIYSDNLWAQEALKPYYPELAANITQTLLPLLTRAGNAHLFEVVLGVRIPTPIHGRRAIKLAAYTLGGENYTVWADRHRPEDGGVFYDADEYADLCFYPALNSYLEGNLSGAVWWFRKGESMWDGLGFYDKAARTEGKYQNYKLGLYLFTARALGFQADHFEVVERVLWSRQQTHGGITTLSWLDGSPFGTANVETTSIALLAYNTEALNRFRVLGEPRLQVESELEVLLVGRVNEPKITLLNLGAQALTNVRVRVQTTSEDLAVLGKTDWWADEIPAGGSITVTPRLYVEEVEGKALRLDVVVDYRDARFQSRTEIFRLGFAGGRSIRLQLYDLKHYPRALEPGGTALVTGVLVNQGGWPARHISLSLELPSGIELGHWARTYIGTLEPDTHIRIRLPLSLSPNLTAGTYQVGLALNYQDPLNRTHRLLAELALQVTSEREEYPVSTSPIAAPVRSKEGTGGAVAGI